MWYRILVYLPEIFLGSRRNRSDFLGRHHWGILCGFRLRGLIGVSAKNWCIWKWTRLTRRGVHARRTQSQSKQASPRAAVWTSLRCRRTAPFAAAEVSRHTHTKFTEGHNPRAPKTTQIHETGFAFCWRDWTRWLRVLGSLHLFKDECTILSFLSLLF